MRQVSRDFLDRVVGADLVFDPVELVEADVVFQPDLRIHDRLERLRRGAGKPQHQHRALVLVRDED